MLNKVIKKYMMDILTDVPSNNLYNKLEEGSYYDNLSIIEIKFFYGIIILNLHKYNLINFQDIENLKYSLVNYKKTDSNLIDKFRYNINIAYGKLNIKDSLIVTNTATKYLKEIKLINGIKHIDVDFIILENEALSVVSKIIKKDFKHSNIIEKSFIYYKGFKRIYYTNGYNHKSNQNMSRFEPDELNEIDRLIRKDKLNKILKV